MKRRLRYAGNVRETDTPTRNVGGLLDAVNNPNSPEFLPPEERGERGKARFWASIKARKDARQSSAET